MTMRRLALTALLLKCLAAVLLPGSAQADMAVIVNPDNPINALSEDEVRQIFLGRMRLFPGTRRNVDPVDQDTAAPGFVHFYQVIAKLTPTALQRLRAMYLFSGKGMLPKRMTTEEEVIAFVSSEPDAIGYVSKDRLTPAVKSVYWIRQ